MKIEKWLYFAKEADEANLNGIDDCVALPAENLVSVSPTANNRVTMYFKSVKNNDPLAAMDSVVLETIVGDAFEVANAIVRYINGSVPHDGFIVVASDVTTTDSTVAALNNLTVPAVYLHPSITGVNAINISQTVLSQYDWPMEMHTGVVPTAAPADAATLAVNTRYNINTTAARAYRIPAAAASRAGDWISLVYTVDIANSTVHSYTTTTDTEYTIGSTIIIPGQDGTRVGVVDLSVSSDNVLTITGATNGDGGRGTIINFRNMTGELNGWAVEAIVQGQGTQAVASASTAFS